MAGLEAASGIARCPRCAWATALHQDTLYRLGDQHQQLGPWRPARTGDDRKFTTPSPAASLPCIHASIRSDDRPSRALTLHALAGNLSGSSHRLCSR
jgi:hypothetical protein